jgi:hypothetical protein
MRRPYGIFKGDYIGGVHFRRMTLTLVPSDVREGDYLAGIHFEKKKRYTRAKRRRRQSA